MKEKTWLIIFLELICSTFALFIFYLTSIAVLGKQTNAHSEGIPISNVLWVLFTLAFIVYLYTFRKWLSAWIFRKGSITSLKRTLLILLSCIGIIANGILLYIHQNTFFLFLFLTLYPLWSLVWHILYYAERKEPS